MFFSGKIVKELGDFVPGAGIIGGALCFGAVLLNPPSSRDKIDNQVSEIRTDIESVRTEMKDIIKIAGDSSEQLSGDISVIQERIGQTYQMVADVKYKVCEVNLAMFSMIRILSPKLQLQIRLMKGFCNGCGSHYVDTIWSTKKYVLHSHAALLLSGSSYLLSPGCCQMQKELYCQLLIKIFSGWDREN